MRYLIAPDSYKGTLTAAEAAGAIRSAILSVDPSAECILLPLADGGEGTVAALVNARAGEPRATVVSGPLGAPVAAAWALLDGGAAVMESASCCGYLNIPKERRNALHTTSRGLGELLRNVAEQNDAREVLCGLGGTATNDCGWGMAQALGYTFAYKNAFGANDVADRLASVIGIDAPDADDARTMKVNALCDVRNPLAGARGATRTFGPQKGIPVEELERMDTAVRHFAGIVRRDVRDVDVDAEFTGAAGGLGFALSAFCGARLTDGAEYVLDAADFNDRCVAADIVLTGEGRVDAQTPRGKLVSAVARRAAALGKRVIAIAGRIDGDAEALRRELGLAALLEATPRGVREDELAGNAERWLRKIVESGEWRVKSKE